MTGEPDPRTVEQAADEMRKYAGLVEGYGPEIYALQRIRGFLHLDDDTQLRQHLVELLAALDLISAERADELARTIAACSHVGGR